jgi:hypothetical protein
VAKHRRLHLESTCTFLQEEEEGSVFGGCICGVPNKYGVPCQHMVAVVKASRIEGLTPIDCMPQWWMTSHWQKQYPSPYVLSCDFNMTTLRMISPFISLKYCLPYSAPNKAGQPKMNKRIKSPLELATKKKAKPTLMNAMESAEISKKAHKPPPELAGNDTTTPTPMDSENQVTNKGSKARKGTRNKKNK